LPQNHRVNFNEIVSDLDAEMPDPNGALTCTFSGELPSAQEGPCNATTRRNGMTVSASSALRPIDDWAAELKVACQENADRSLACILKLSEVYHAAKTGLPYGRWTQMWRNKRQYGLSHTLRTGDKYALIGQEFGATDWKDPSSLPAGVDALFYLAQIGRDLVDELTYAGTIDENLSAKKALALRDQYRPDLKRKPRPFNVLRWLNSFHGHMEALAVEGGQEGLTLALPDIEEALRQLTAKLHRLMQEKSLSV
jgi:hypothetical protein